MGEIACLGIICGEAWKLEIGYEAEFSETIFLPKFLHEESNCLRFHRKRGKGYDLWNFSFF